MHPSHKRAHHDGQVAVLRGDEQALKALRCDGLYSCFQPAPSELHTTFSIATIWQRPQHRAGLASKGLQSGIAGAASYQDSSEHGGRWQLRSTSEAASAALCGCGQHHSRAAQSMLCAACCSRHVHTPPLNRPHRQRT